MFLLVGSYLYKECDLADLHSGVTRSFVNWSIASMLIGTHRMRIKIRFLKPEYPIVGFLEWLFDTALAATVFLLVFAGIFYLLNGVSMWV